ncbi:MAG: GNAT family N-acetyltransferase [Synechococcales bacterium]|nr:GNAT family N-acetyltransferase [Synechococcales bacterium]
MTPATPEPVFTVADEGHIEILLPLVQGFYGIFDYPFDASEMQAVLLPLLRDATLGCVLLIQIGPTPVGYLILTFGYSLESRGRDAILDEFFVQEAYQGQGIGTVAIAHLLNHLAPQLGIKMIYLVVERSNLRACKFYSRLGFVAQDRILMAAQAADLL